MSRQHARLSVNERGYFRLEDPGSTNGIIYQGGG
ncbi:MAG: FHA domain-containing protein [Deltaproteobacteria bacterium]|nr:FHA domain-containing protein [Deltaproteobacteria bacterium]